MMANPSHSADLVIVGSGSLAEKVLSSLSQLPLPRLRVAVIARSLAKIAETVRIANACAAISGVSTTFTALEIGDFNARAFSKAFRSLKPKLIFHAASLQSPWESAQGQTAWTTLISEAGFGITLPLQMALITEVSRAATDSQAAIVNASYPDCVNVALDRLGYRVTCGIGNVAIVEAFCRSHPLAARADVRVVSHHGHLSGWLKASDAANLPRIWVKSREVKPLRLSPQLGSVSEKVNEVTASTAVSVIHALLTGETRNICVPGVPGFPGGYPFLIKNRKFTLRFPSGIHLPEALAHNKTGELSDGLDIGAGVQFTGKARSALAAVGFEYAQGFAFADWSTVCAALLGLRDRLRSRHPEETRLPQSFVSVKA